MNIPVGVEHVRAALALRDFDVDAARVRMAPNPRGINIAPREDAPRQAGVLVLLYPEADGLHILLTRRTAGVRDHSGQVSFPGGQRDPEDESFAATALREACEELGICDVRMEVLGALSMLYIPPSHFQVFPTVALVEALPALTPNPHEVAEVFSLPVARLLDDAAKGEEQWDFRGAQVQVQYYDVRGHKVWGATAIMLAELEGRLRQVLG